MYEYSTHVHIHTYIVIIGIDYVHTSTPNIYSVLMYICNINGHILT